MKTRLIIAFVLASTVGLLIAAKSTQAEPIAPITQFLNEQLYYLGTAADQGGGLSDLKKANGMMETQGSEFQFSGFWLRLWANVGFDVPGLVTLSLIPEIELIWE